jgi:hypothetical protein
MKTVQMSEADLRLIRHALRTHISLLYSLGQGTKRIGFDCDREMAQPDPFIEFVKTRNLHDRLVRTHNLP